MPYKILSLDGGASWCMVQARVLQDIYGDVPGHELLKQFDTVIANSGGSVLLGLLCSNMTLSEIVSFYKNSEKLKQVFPRLLPWERFFLQLLQKSFGLGPKYSAARKLRGLRKLIVHDPQRTTADVLGTFLNDIPSLFGKNDNGREVQIVISAFDYFRQRAGFFRSNINSSAGRFNSKYYQVTLGEAIHASTNAPVNYYDAPATVRLKLLTGNRSEKDNRNSWFWDGAVAGFNNPVLAGLVEAITNNKDNIGLNEFFVLTLGTGLSRKAIITDDVTSDNSQVRRLFKINKGKPFVEDKKNFGFMNDVKKISSGILSDPPDSATFIAYSFLNPTLNNNKSTLVRINPLISPECNEGIYGYPAVYNNDKKNFIKLMNLDFDIWKDEDIKLIDTMCDRFIANTKNGNCLQNQLIRGEFKNAPDSNGYLGYPTYLQAKERWLQLINKGAC